MEDLTGGIVQGRLNFRFTNEKVINFNISKRGTSRDRSKNEKMGMSKGNIKRLVVATRSRNRFAKNYNTSSSFKDTIALIYYTPKNKATVPTTFNFN